MAAGALPVPYTQAVTPVALRLHGHIAHRPRHTQQSHALSRNRRHLMVAQSGDAEIAATSQLRVTCHLKETPREGSIGSALTRCRRKCSPEGS